MAKVKGYLAGSKGKIGNLTFYRNSANGETQVREIVEVKNPKTKAQRIQRVIALTTIKNYQAMKAICDHSFEGKTMGAQNMNRFNALNMRTLRERAAQIQNQGGSLNEYYNFIALGSNEYAPAAMIIAEGSLPQIDAAITSVNNHYRFAFEMGGTTYGDIIENYGLQRGDQLTFCFVGKNLINGRYEFHYSRVILDPRNEDGSGAALTTPFVADGAINKPNKRNQGALDFLAVNGTVMTFSRRALEIAAAAVIVSRKGNNYWFRSNAKLVLSEECIGADLTSLDAASEEASTELYIENNDAYLNNAGVGGSEGTSEGGVIPPGPEDDTPIYNNTVVINGVSQNVSGGSVNVTAPLNSIKITGFNMPNDSVVAEYNDSPIAPNRQSDTSVEWANLNIAAGSSVKVFKEGMQWFRVTVSADGGHDGGDDG